MRKSGAEKKKGTKRVGGVRFAAAGAAESEGKDDVEERTSKRPRLFVAMHRAKHKRANFAADLRSVGTLFGVQDTGAKDGGRVATSSALCEARTCFRAPLFQRRYCWPAAVITTLWGDVLRQAEARQAESGGDTDGLGSRHSLGKVIVVHEAPDGGEAVTNGGDVCVDGQQRMTTTLLLIAAIRDAALAHSSTEDDVATRDEVVRLANAALFLSPSHAATFSSAFAAFVEGASGAAITNDLLLAHDAQLAQIDALCRATTWAPTLLDRLAFIQAVAMPTSAAAGAVDTGDSMVAAAKATFHGLLVGRLSTCPRGDKAAWLLSVLRAVLHGLYVTVLTVKRGDPQQLFESVARFAEAGHVFFRLPIQRSGRTLASADLVRNLVLSMFPKEQQVDVYRHRWIPLETAIDKLAAARGVAAFGDVPSGIPESLITTVTRAADDDDEDDEDDSGAHDDERKDTEDAGAHEGERHNTFFFAFLRGQWGFETTKAIPGHKMLHSELDVAFPAFAAAVNHKLAQHMAATTSRAPDASSATTASTALGGNVLGVKEEAELPKFAASVIDDLHAFLTTCREA